MHGVVNNISQRLSYGTTDALTTFNINEIKLTVNGTHYMRWQLPFILAYSITTHKSQSMTAHNGIVYVDYKRQNV